MICRYNDHHHHQQQATITHELIHLTFIQVHCLVLSEPLLLLRSCFLYPKAPNETNSNVNCIYNIYIVNAL